MSSVAGTIPESVNRLVDEYRHRCLWFLRSDYYPETDTQRLQVLEYIERHGDREAFRRAAEIRRWLCEAEIGRSGEVVLMEWARDSAYRFFPLLQHADLGLTLHPFDLATNKTLALVGRLEVRDWVDLIHACDRIQPLGYLAWAACGKDPGFSPKGILETAGQTARYSAEEVRGLAFAGEAPVAEDLSRRWHAILGAAREIVDILPLPHLGRCVLTSTGDLFRGDATELQAAVDRDQLVFHPGRIGGAWPEIKQR